jgi:bifunctional non-homologous end joining protein LigD
MTPTLAKTPPVGPQWIHEVKFDGFRSQVHFDGDDITIYSRNGADFTRRFRRLKPAVASLPVRNAIIDREVVACDESGQAQLPHFDERGHRQRPLSLVL